MNNYINILNNITYQFTALGLLILILAYMIKITIYAEDCDNDISNIIKDIDKNILKDINIKIFSIGDDLFKVGQKVSIVTNWYETYTATILGLNTKGVLYSLIDNNKTVYAIDIRAINSIKPI